MVAIAKEVDVATYSVAVELTVPVSNDEPLDFSAVASVDSDGHVSIDVQGSDVTDWPTERPVYLKQYVAHIPACGPTQTWLDDELRTALGEQGWGVT